MLRIADEQLGLMRQQLKANGQEEDTIWMISSDNGGLRYEGKSRQPVTDNGPLRAGKGHLYEGGLRVPLIVKAPGWSTAGQTVQENASSSDLYPTLMEIVGRKKPEGIDGISLAALISGKESKLKPEAIYWHYSHYSNQGGVPGGSILEGDWKLIEFYEDGRRELFQLKEDPGELKNLAVLEKKRTEQMWNPANDLAKADQGLSGVEKETVPVLKKRSGHYYRCGGVELAEDGTDRRHHAGWEECPESNHHEATQKGVFDKILTTCIRSECYEKFSDGM